MVAAANHLTSVVTSNSAKIDSLEETEGRIAGSLIKCKTRLTRPTCRLSACHDKVARGKDVDKVLNHFAVSELLSNRISGSRSLRSMAQHPIRW